MAWTAWPSREPAGGARGVLVRCENVGSEEVYLGAGWAPLIRWDALYTTYVSSTQDALHEANSLQAFI